jgi:hypothetical protein
MNARDEMLLMQGAMIGVVYFANELQRVMGGLDQRVARVEREVRPPPPPPRRVPRVRLQPVWRDGERLYRIAGRCG